MQRRYRVIVAKPGLDGHDRGARVVAMGLRDAGFEVIYTGLFQTPARIAAIAVDEGADAVGLSILSGAHMHLFSAVLDELKRQGADDVVVFGGGIIPEEDAEVLRAAGVGRVFTPGATNPEIAAWLEQTLDQRGGQECGGKTSP